MEKAYYLSTFLYLTQANEAVIDNLIRYKHLYIIIIADKEYLIEAKCYVPSSFTFESDGTYSLKINYLDKTYSITGISDIIGFGDYEHAIEYCDETTDCLCSKPDEKLIFSPPLAKYLITHGFQIIDIKPKRDNPKEIIPIFRIDPGFYQCIKEFKANHKL